MPKEKNSHWDYFQGKMWPLIKLIVLACKKSVFNQKLPSTEKTLFSLEKWFIYHSNTTIVLHVKLWEQNDYEGALQSRVQTHLSDTSVLDKDEPQEGFLCRLQKWAGILLGLSSQVSWNPCLIWLHSNYEKWESLTSRELAGCGIVMPRGRTCERS